MAGGHESLVHLFHIWLLNNIPELFLAQKKDLQQGLSAHLQIGEQPKLFQCGCGEILSFVNDQEGTLAGFVVVDKKPGQLLQKQ